MPFRTAGASLPRLIEAVLKGAGVALPMVEIQRRLLKWHDDNDVHSALDKMAAAGCIEVSRGPRVSMFGRKQVKYFKFVERRRERGRQRRDESPGDDEPADRKTA